MNAKVVAIVVGGIIGLTLATIAFVIQTVMPRAEAPPVDVEWARWHAARALAEIFSPCLLPQPIPDDGLNDTPVVQGLLDSQNPTCNEVELLAGQYDFDPVLPRNVNNIPTLRLVGRKALTCEIGTVVNFRGNAGHSAWQGLLVTAEGGLVAGCLFRTEELINTEEQTHVIQVGMYSRNPESPGKEPTIAANWFYHPKPAVGMICTNNPTVSCTVNADCVFPGLPSGTCVQPKKGDCIRSIGQDDLTATSTIIRGNHFVTCDRSGISVHGNVNGLAIVANTFSFAGDQWIDAETGTGTGGTWAITGNTFLDEPQRGGVGFQFASRNEINFSGNAVHGRGGHFGSAKKVTFGLNTIVSPSTSNAPIVDLHKSTSEMTVVGNTIRREPGLVQGNVLKIPFVGTGFPGKITVTGNNLLQARRCTLDLTKACSVDTDCSSATPPAGNCVYPTETVVLTQGAQDLVITGNLIEGGGVGVHVSDNGRKPEGITIGANTFRGENTAVQVNGGNFGVGRVTVTGNTGASVNVGLKCNNVTAAMGPVVSSGNNWPVNQCPTATGGI